MSGILRRLSLRKSPDPRNQITELQEKLRINHEVYKVIEDYNQVVLELMIKNNLENREQAKLKRVAIEKEIYRLTELMERKRQNGLVSLREYDPHLASKVNELQKELAEPKNDRKQLHRFITGTRVNFMTANAEDVAKLRHLLKKCVDLYEGTNKELAKDLLKEIDINDPEYLKTTEHDVIVEFPGYVKRLVDQYSDQILKVTEIKKVESEMSKTHLEQNPRSSSSSISSTSSSSNEPEPSEKSPPKSRRSFRG